jgi:transposase
MRGEERRQRSMLLVVNLKERIPKEHPLRRIKQMADAALKELSPIFEQMYSPLGRPSIPPERLLKASLLMALYTIRSERMFCEQLDYNLLFRWFWIWSWTSRALTIRALRPTATVCWNTRSPETSSGE